MTRVEITLGLLTIVGAIALTGLIGLRENDRMAHTDRGYDVRSVETGAMLFNQYCAACHGPNASGLNCPPLDETSGLHGGDIGVGIAWRLEEQHWDRTDSFGYVYSIISAGRTVSTRPNRYRGLDENAMAMPAWSQRYAGPLRDDQIRDIANYVVNFREYFPDANADGAREDACETVVANIQTTGAPAPSIAGYENACAELLGVELEVAPAATPAAADADAGTPGTPGTGTAESAGTGTPGAAGTGTPGAGTPGAGDIGTPGTGDTGTPGAGTVTAVGGATGTP